MKNILTVFILGMLTFSSAFSSSSIELNDFLKSIAYDAKNEKGVMLNEWEPEGSSRSIIWNKDGMNWSEDGFIREAKIYLGNKGKITHKKNSGSNIDGYWYLTLKGDNNGLSMVKLKSNSATFDNPKVIDNNSGFTKRMLCENKENLQTILYEISLPDKKPFWAKEFIKLTETGEGAGYLFTFGGQPSCSLWDMDQSEIKRKIDNCKHTGGSHISYKNLNHNTAIGACEIAIEISPKDKEVQYLLGRAYQKGGNNTKALDWYRESSKNGYADAQYALGTMYLNGIGIEKDPAKAYALYNDAAKGGNSEAYIAIGVLHIKGEVVEKNYDKAKSYFRKAIAEGNKKGEDYLKKLDALIDNEKKAQEKAMQERTNLEKKNKILQLKDREQIKKEVVQKKVAQKSSSNDIASQVNEPVVYPDEANQETTQQVKALNKYSDEAIKIIKNKGYTKLYTNNGKSFEFNVDFKDNGVVFNKKDYKNIQSLLKNNIAIKGAITTQLMIPNDIKTNTVNVKINGYTKHESGRAWFNTFINGQKNKAQLFDLEVKHNNGQRYIELTIEIGAMAGKYGVSEFPKVAMYLANISYMATDTKNSEKWYALKPAK